MLQLIPIMYLSKVNCYFIIIFILMESNIDVKYKILYNFNIEKKTTYFNFLYYNVSTYYNYIL